MVYIKFGITGIQDFIFNVTSKGAAKSLRSRSFFIEACTNLAEERLLKEFSTATEIYNGGGNFILRLPTDKFLEDKFNNVIDEIGNLLLKYNIKIVAAFYIAETKNFGEILTELNSKTNQSKYKPNKYISYYNAINDKIKERLEDVGNINQSLINSKSYSIDGDNTKVLTQRFTFYNNYEGKYKIVQNVPKWNSSSLSLNQLVIDNLISDDENLDVPAKGESISFQYLSEFAKRRSGTSKVGVLKLDVDNFGAILRNLEDLSHYQELSKRVTNFFEDDVLNLMEGKYEYTEVFKKGEKGKKNDTVHKSEIIKDNIYTVFLGGDDCFLIGSWDVLLDFVYKLKVKFEAFSELLRKDLDFLDSNLTFSASFILIDSHFPVIKFSDIAEDELFRAKNHYPDRKNAFSIFKEILPFEDLEEMLLLKNKFKNMVLEDGTEKGIIQKFVNLFTNSDNIYWQKNGKPFNPAIIWRFIFIMRDIKDKFDYKSTFFNQSGIHDKYIKDSFKNNDMKHRYIQIGARITEFLTKTK